MNFIDSFLHDGIYLLFFFRMIIQSFPAEDVDPAIGSVHPVLLHVVRIGKGKRDQDLEPVPTYFHWKQVFEIQDNNVYIINRTSELDRRPDGSERNVPLKDLVTLVEDGSIVLGKKRGQLNLILLQPKQKSRAHDDEATVTKVLMDRLNLSQEAQVAEYEKYFKGKNSKNLKRVRLKVEFIFDSGICMSIISHQTIVDSGNKDIGAMDFVDAGPLRSCIKGKRLVVVASEYILSKDIVPVFQVFTQDNNQDLVQRSDLEERIQQPDSVEIRNTAIIFSTPPQPLLHSITENFTLKLAIKRQGDGYICSKKFDFTYEPHSEGNCLHCDWMIDAPKLPFWQQEMLRQRSCISMCL